MLEVRRGLDLGEEALGADHGRELGLEHLERDLPIVLEVLGEIYRGHPPRPELTLDAVPVGERRRERVGYWHEERHSGIEEARTA